MKKKDFLIPIASAIIGKLGTFFLEESGKLLGKPIVLLAMVSSLTLIAVIVWALIMWAIRLYHFNQAEIVLGDLLRTMDETLLRQHAALDVSGPIAFQHPGARMTPSHHEIIRESQRFEQLKVEYLTGKLAARFGGKIHYDELEKLVRKRLS